jgi:ech hydrogenase subunit D
MDVNQEIKAIGITELPDETSFFWKNGYRLVQISCAKIGDILELSYSFDKDGKLTHLRVAAPSQNAEIPSISDIYFCAFTYENEIHDLYNVKFNGLVLDFKGAFYRTSVPHAFNPPKETTSEDKTDKTNLLNGKADK